MTYTIKPIYLSGYLRGDVFYQNLKASSISNAISNVGEILQSVDGSIHYLHRAYKRSWDVQWQMIIYSGSPTYPLDTVVKLRTIVEAFDSLETDLLLVFEEKSYNVIVDPNSWQADLAANSVSMTNIPYYNVSFRLLEV
jgi:hypothetical protein